MKARLKRFLAQIVGRLPHSLPIGKTEFDAFCVKIFNTYNIPDEPTYRQAIATMIMHQSAQTNTIPLYWFKRSIHKAQANQVAFHAIQEAKKFEEQKELDEKTKVVESQSNVTPIVSA